MFLTNKQTIKDTNVTKTNKLMTSLEAVKADVVMIKEAMTAQKLETTGKTRNSAKSLSACESCQGKGQAERCGFVCGPRGILRGAASKRDQKRETGGGCIRGTGCS